MRGWGSTLPRVTLSHKGELGSCGAFSGQGRDGGSLGNSLNHLPSREGARGSAGFGGRAALGLGSPAE